MSIHTSHPEIIKRLKRAAGHLAKVVSMMEEGSECVNVAQQLHAVESAITTAKRTFIRDHIDHCLEHTLDEAQSEEAVKEFKEITKYL